LDLYNLGPVTWTESQLIYHALAELGREALVLLSPTSPYVCIGYHQDAREEVDLDYCLDHDLPVFRRKVGGGAVYLDGNQFFFQLILRRDNPLIPNSRESFYEKFLRPVIDAYKRIGIPAEYKPVNDVLAGRCKISGTGVGEIGPCLVFVGNLILDFDFETMARVLKAPDEKFRDKVHQTMRANMTTIRRELGPEEAARWSESSLNEVLTEEFEKILGPLEPKKVDPGLKTTMASTADEMLNDEWLFEQGRRLKGRELKIRAGVTVRHRVHKAPGGLIRTVCSIENERFSSVSISGDFFCYPPEAVHTLESMLEDRSVQEARDALGEFYRIKNVETAGIDIDDWLEVLTG